MNELIKEIQSSLDTSKVCFSDLEELEEMITPCGGGCSCSSCGVGCKCN